MTISRVTRCKCVLSLALTAAAVAPVAAIAAPGDPIITIWYGTDQVFGDPGIAQRWVNILGNASDPDGIATLTYTLNGASSQFLSVGPDTRRLFDPGDFNIELDKDALPAGVNEVIITATDNTQASANTTVHFTYVPDKVWPESFAIDWSTVGNIQDVAQVVDGQWDVSSAGVRTAELGYDRTIGFGDYEWDDYEVVVPITMHALHTSYCNLSTTPCGMNGCPWPSSAPAFAVLLRWPGHTAWDSSQPRWGYEPAGAGFWWDAACGGPLALRGDLGLDVEDNSKSLQFGVRYLCRVRVQTVPGTGVYYAGKIWQDGTQEPAGWDLSGFEGPADVPSGSLLIVAHHVDLTVGNLSITPLPDPNPPIIRDIAVNTTETTATITWKTNEKSTSRVEYGLTAGYELGAVDDSSYETVHTIPLSGLTTGEVYHYRVSSVDVDSNGASSDDATFLVSADSVPPILSAITATPAETSATITWTTDEPATSIVDYGLTAAYTLSVSDPALTTAHALIIPDITCGSRYHFRVRSADVAANEATSADDVFWSADTLAPLVEDFETYNCDSNALDWYDTAADNSTSENDALFSVVCLGPDRVMGTSSNATNIHSHYLGGCSANWHTFTYSGRMMLVPAGGGVGVTFLSDYPNSDAYYRLRRYGGTTFHISPHGTDTTGGITDTGVTPVAGTWYYFLIEVTAGATQTDIKAKVWAEGDAEPLAWQVDCYDDSPTRLQRGTVGVWSTGGGSKFWDDLQGHTCDIMGNVTITDLPSFAACTESAPPVPDSCCVYDTDMDGDVDLRDFAVFQRQFIGQ